MKHVGVVEDSFGCQKGDVKVNFRGTENTLTPLRVATRADLPQSVYTVALIWLPFMLAKADMHHCTHMRGYHTGPMWLL